MVSSHTVNGVFKLKYNDRDIPYPAVGFHGPLQGDP